MSHENYHGWIGMGEYYCYVCLSVVPAVRETFDYDGQHLYSLASMTVDNKKHMRVKLSSLRLVSIHSFMTYLPKL